jgi:hypothetical protein
MARHRDIVSLSPPPSPGPHAPPKRSVQPHAPAPISVSVRRLVSTPWRGRPQGHRSPPTRNSRRQRFASTLRRTTPTPPLRRPPHAPAGSLAFFLGLSWMLERPFAKGPGPWDFGHGRTRDPDPASRGGRAEHPHPPRTRERVRGRKIGENSKARKEGRSPSGPLARNSANLLTEVKPPVFEEAVGILG